MTTIGLDAIREPRSPVVTKDVLQETAALFGVQVPERWESGFVELLNGARDLMEEFANMQGASIPRIVTIRWAASVRR